MKNSRFTLAALLVSFALTSCHREEQQPLSAGPVFEHVFSVDAELPLLEQEPDSKGYLGSYISANWSEGDKLSVVNLTKGKILGGELTADGSGTRTTFSGTVSGTISTGDKIALFYPSFGLSEEDDFDSRNFSIAQQSAASNAPLVTFATFTADRVDGSFSGLNLSFFYVLSYLKINMANLPAEAAVSKISLVNVPDNLTLTVNSDKTGFDIATAQEKAAKGKITVSGQLTTSASGTMTLSVGVMPSDEASDRKILVTVDGVGVYASVFASAQLSSHKYYNTVSSLFECIGTSENQSYGLFRTGAQIVEVDAYQESSCNVICGTESGEADFSLVNNFANSYWTLKGIPEDAAEGTTFTARVYSFGIDFAPSLVLEGAEVVLTEDEGDFTKLWVRAGDYLFIVRK